jgi:hypothetical protein
VEYERELVIRTAGALPVVAKLADRLGLVEAVDRFCPIRSVADYTHGQVVLALVANRLTHPRPLSSFEDWGEDFAVAETLGIAACSSTTIGWAGRWMRSPSGCRRCST